MEMLVERDRPRAGEELLRVVEDVADGAPQELVLALCEVHRGDGAPIALLGVERGPAVLRRLRRRLPGELRERRAEEVEATLPAVGVPEDGRVFEKGGGAAVDVEEAGRPSGVVGGPAGREAGGHVLGRADRRMFAEVPGRIDMAEVLAEWVGHEMADRVALREKRVEELDEVAAARGEDDGGFAALVPRAREALDVVDERKCIVEAAE